MLIMYVTMKLPFVSSREGQDGENQNQNRSRTIQISVPCELVMDLLSQGAILQLQMGPVPLRPNLTRPERPEATNPRPEAETVNIRPNADEHCRPNPAGGSDIDPPRPERPPSRHPAVRTVRTVRPIRPVSPFTDWSSLSDNDVISVSSEDEDNYVPRSPEYILNSPGPEDQTEDQNPGHNNNSESGPSRRNIPSNDNEDRPRSPLGRGNFLQRVSPFQRGLGHTRRQLGRIRPM